MCRASLITWQHMSDGNESPVNQQEASPLPVPVSPDGEEYEYTYNITISYPGGKEKVFSVNAWKPLSVSFPVPLPSSELVLVITCYLHRICSLCAEIYSPYPWR